MSYTYTWQEGLSMRDYFAGQIIVGLLANEHHRARALGDARDGQRLLTDEIALFAYQMAEAMLRAREEVRQG